MASQYPGFRASGPSSIASPLAWDPGLAAASYHLVVASSFISPLSLSYDLEAQTSKGSQVAESGVWSNTELRPS
ncbi:hypothetical protein BOTBODRAFT_168796 [Botryobasidium botryosum FD-172 SS1]|uniref:Uncharacterized protein n=1 Tax=Botryobasidium botryosum (strain FD-172 SS1) TaxID=930990 RepID=A0A067NCM5_BOTB1|nr:hypothetical protein BOTBODRAFT_168796 [Botryobasidium botryosum FD-172 SS1]